MDRSQPDCLMIASLVSAGGASSGRPADPGSGRTRGSWPWAGRPAGRGAVVALAVAVLALAVAGCTSDPNAPINQTPPIRRMDHFFNSVSGTPNPDYRREPGYAPAYPPY